MAAWHRKEIEALMRIVHIAVGKVNPDSMNGVSKVVHWMATSQFRQGHDVEVWGLTTSRTPSTRSREYKLRLFPMTRLRVTLGRELKVALGCLEPDTWVHFHSVFTPEFPAISRLLKTRGIAYSVTPHGIYASSGLKKSPWKKRLWIAVREARHLRNAAWIQAVGASEIEDIRRIAPRTRVVLIPNGQEPLPAYERVVPASVERPLIGFCGRLATQQKGLDYLIEGFADYRAKGGKGELWLIGDGGDRSELEKLAAQSGGQPQVRFLGEKHGEEKLNMLANLDAFIHSSRWEGLPMSCLEAASLGKPLLISRETNLAKFIEKSGAGLVLDETSAAGVERALKRVQRLYEDNTLEQMGENARLLIEREFSWEENARSFVAAIAAARRTIERISCGSFSGV
jgi:glycosyltransferase involved in cell wall biosynthesis